MASVNMHRLVPPLLYMSMYNAIWLCALFVFTAVYIYQLREAPVSFECKKIMHLMVVLILPGVIAFFTGERSMCKGAASWYDFWSCLQPTQCLWNGAVAFAGFYLYNKHGHRIKIPILDAGIVMLPVQQFLELQPGDDMVSKGVSMVPVFAGLISMWWMQTQMLQAYAWVQCISIVLAVCQLVFDFSDTIKSFFV